MVYKLPGISRSRPFVAAIRRGYRLETASAGSTCSLCLTRLSLSLPPSLLLSLACTPLFDCLYLPGASSSCTHILFLPSSSLSSSSTRPLSPYHPLLCSRASLWAVSEQPIWLASPHAQQQWPVSLLSQLPFLSIFKLHITTSMDSAADQRLMELQMVGPPHYYGLRLCIVLTDIMLKGGLGLKSTRIHLGL